jgi:hypothetical protein
VRARRRGGAGERDDTGAGSRNTSTGSSPARLTTGHDPIAREAAIQERAILGDVGATGHQKLFAGGYQADRGKNPLQRMYPGKHFRNDDRRCDAHVRYDGQRCVPGALPGRSVVVGFREDAGRRNCQGKGE